MKDRHASGVCTSKIYIGIEELKGISFNVPNVNFPHKFLRGVFGWG